MTDYRNIQDLDEFDNLVENFVKNRLQLKQKVKQERGNLSRKKADAKLKAEPITESLAELKTSLAEKGGFLKMFERFSGVSKSQSEIKLTTKANEGRLGTHGFVDLADLQDGILRVRNSKTGDSFNVQLDEDLGELLFKPYRNIDLDEIDNQALNLYYQIMKVAGISSRANNNRKIKKAKEVHLSGNTSDVESDEVQTDDEKPRKKQSPSVFRRRRKRRELQRTPADVESDEVETDDEEEKKLTPTRSSISKENPSPRRSSRLKGKGFMMNGDDMINRFYLLCQSMGAGNESDEMLNEMMDLLDNLLENNYITTSQHKTLYHNYIND